MQPQRAFQSCGERLCAEGRQDGAPTAASEAYSDDETLHVGILCLRYTTMNTVAK